MSYNFNHLLLWGFKEMEDQISEVCQFWQMTDFVSCHNLWHCHSKMAAVSFRDGHENCLNLTWQWQLTEFQCFTKKIYLYLFVYIIYISISTFYHNFIDMFYIFYGSLKMGFGGLSVLTDDRFHVASQLDGSCQFQG